MTSKQKREHKRKLAVVEKLDQLRGEFICAQHSANTIQAELSIIAGKIGKLSKTLAEVLEVTKRDGPMI